jgi:hypothetical protein
LKRKAGKIVLIEWIGESASLLHTRIRSHQPGRNLFMSQSISCRISRFSCGNLVVWLSLSIVAAQKVVMGGARSVRHSQPDGELCPTCRPRYGDLVNDTCPRLAKWNIQAVDSFSLSPLTPSTFGDHDCWRWTNGTHPRRPDLEK